MKKFKLNNKQNLMISKHHELFNDVLIAHLAGQDVDSIVGGTLLEMGYNKNYPTGYYYNRTDMAPRATFPEDVIIK